MKKFVVLSLFGLLIMAFSATVYAQKLDFKASGFIDAQTFWYRNVGPGNAASGIYNTVAGDYLPGAAKAYDQSVAYLESRARLKFDAVMDKNLSGTIFFEMDSARWGDISPSGAQRNAYGYWAADRAAVEIKNLYIDFGLPYFGIAAPMTMRVGLQTLGIRPKLLVLTDGMGVTMGIKADPVTISPFWYKALEGKDARSDDVDVYGFQISGKAETFTLGGYALFYDMKTYPFYTEATFLPYGSVTDKKAKMWWLGLYADGKAGPVDLNFDLIVDTGEVKSRSGLKSVDYAGWTTYLKIDYPWEKFNLGLVGMYASGANANKTSATGRPGEATAIGTVSTKVGSYVVPPGSEVGAVFGESLVLYSSWVNRGDSGIGDSLNYTEMCRGPVGGTWMAKVYGSYKVSPDYKITLAGLYIGDTTKNGDTFGTSRKADGTLKDEKTIGWEFDLYNEFQIYKNLKYVIAGGVMTVGDAFKFWDGTGNDKPKTPWIITTNLTYTFN